MAQVRIYADKDLLNKVKRLLPGGNVLTYTALVHFLLMEKLKEAKQ